MKEKRIALSLLALLVAQTVKADYTVYYRLEDGPLKFVVHGIDGSVKFDRTTILRGESSNVIWNYKYINKIDIEGLGTYTEKSGSTSVNPIQSKFYNVTVRNGENYKNEKLYLTVVQPDPEILFTSDRYKIGEGESVNLSWDIKNIDSASIDNNIGVINSKSTVKITPDDDITYKLTAKGYFGEKEATKLLSIDVVKNSFIQFLSVNKNKFTVGEQALFNWSVTDSENLELQPYGKVDLNTTSKAVLLNTAGTFDYSLKSTSFNNSIQSSNVVPISVYNNPTINSFTVNNKKSVDVETGDDIKFDWTANYSEVNKLDGSIISGTSTTLKALDTNKTYMLEAFNGAGKSISDSVMVNIVEPVAISTFTAPSIVFNNAPFIMNWAGLSVSKYELSSTTGSGVASGENVGLDTNKTITPTTSGNYTYTLKAINLADKSTTKTTVVSVEADPTLSSLMVNGQSSITVSPSTALSFSMVGASSGATLQGRNSAGTADTVLPTVANSVAGSTNYYAASFKTLNSVGRYSPVSSVSVTVVNAPTVVSFTSPNNVFSNSAFTLSWTSTNATNYNLKSNNATSGISTTDVDLGTAVSKSVTPTSAGTYIYTLKVTNAAGVSTSSTKQVVVENSPTFSDFTVNGTNSVTVSPSDTLTFSGSGFSSGATLQGRDSAGTANATLPTTASATAGTTTYYAAATKTVNGVTNNSAVRSVSVTVVNAPNLTSVTAPTTVFSNENFTMSWAGTNATNYKIKSNNVNSGIPTTDIDLDTDVNTIITPTAAGTYVYTITATNAAGVTSTKTSTVVVEAAPTFTGFTVNGSSTVTVAPSTSLSFLGAGFSSGATLQGRNSAGTANATLPTTASATAGTTTYYASAMKTINGISNYSAVRTVSVLVVNAPTVTSITAPTLVFQDSAFTMSWAGTNATNYKIKANSANAGIATTDIDLGTATTTTITPTASGTYVYTITATNAAGVTATKTATVVVEAAPTFTGFTVNGSSTVTVSPSSVLSFLGTGYSSGATLQGRNSAGTANATLPTTASATAGSTTYYASAMKTINGITNYSAVRSVSVIVVNAPSIASMTSPTPVFEDSAFTMSWSASNAVNYTIKSNNNASGIPTTDIDLGTAITTSITPTAAGTYIYTLTATNAAGVTATKTSTVVVEAAPTFTGFTVNGLSTVTVSPSTSLSFLGTGFSTGATLQGRNSAGTANATLPTTASATAGTTTYYAGAMKTINGITNYSAVRSVSVLVVNAPSITSMTAPTPVFEDSAFTMSWVGTNATNYKIKANSANSGIATTDIDLDTATTTSITPIAAGTYTYTLTATNAAGVTTSSTKQVVVEALPTFTGFTVNGTSIVTVAPSAALSFLGTGYSSGATLQGRNSAGSANATLPTTASATAGTTTYYAAAMKTINGITNYSAVRSVSVVVVNAPSITSITAPTPVFMNSAFTMSWAASNAVDYTIKSNNAASGIPTTDIDLDINTSLDITPTAAGTYTYTLTAINAAGVTTSSTKQVVVEALPTFTGFTVNGLAAINVAPSAALTFAGTGFSTGATLQGRNSSGTANATLPSTASATAGTTTYYASAAKTLNGVNNNSAVRSLTVTVVSAPVISSITAPTPVFMNSAFTMSWAGTDVSNYTIKSNNATSGIATTDVDLGSATSKSITPTAAGTYVYTITATNSAGVTSSKTATVVVEALPTFTNFTVNSTVTSVTVAPSASLTFTGTGFSTGATLQGRNSAGTANATLPTTASATAGTITYYASAVKVLNGVTNYSAVRSVDVVVAANPVISSLIAPSTVFSGEAFTMSWVATDAVSYKIKANNANSGIPTTDVDLLTATSKIITPTAAGNYTYTITATNSVGVSVTRTASISVTNSYLKIINPQASSGIYNVTNGQGGTFPAYVNMSMDGGNWILITRWTSFPSTRTFNNVVVNGQTLSTYTMDTTNYPVIPSGYLNNSGRVLFSMESTKWINLYGQWQSFNTFSSSAVLGVNGFSVSTPLGARTLYAQDTGWASVGATTAPMSTGFGLWTVYGNSGPCGGANVAGYDKICPGMSTSLETSHLDKTSVKNLYIKASN